MNAATLLLSIALLPSTALAQQEAAPGASPGNGMQAPPGAVQPLPPELGALFHRIIGTLVRLIEPRR